MSLIVNGVEVQAINVVQGGVTTALNKLVCNGTTVWQGTSWKTIAEGSFGGGGRLSEQATYTLTDSDMGIDDFDYTRPTRITGVCKFKGSTVNTFTEFELGNIESFKTIYQNGYKYEVKRSSSSGGNITLRITPSTLAVYNITITKIEQYY